MGAFEPWASRHAKKTRQATTAAAGTMEQLLAEQRRTNEWLAAIYALLQGDEPGATEAEPTPSAAWS